MKIYGDIMTKEELSKIIKEDIIVVKLNNKEELVKIIEKRSGEFNNIEEALDYIKSILKDNRSEYINPKYFRIFIDNLPEKIIQQDLNKILDEMIKFFANENIENFWIKDEIENMVQNLPNKVKLDNYENLVEFITNQQIEDMSNLSRALLIEKYLPINGINSLNYKRIFEHINKIYETEIASNISRIEQKLIMKLPENVKAKEYENFVDKILNLDKNEDNKSIRFMEFASSLPSEFLLNTYEQIINQYFSIGQDSSMLDFDVFLSKMFKINGEQEVDDEKINSAINFIKQKIEDNLKNKFKKERFYKTIATSLPEKYIKSNFNVVKDMFDRTIPSDVCLYLLDYLEPATIYKFEDELEMTISNNTLEHYKKYFNYLTSNIDNAIIENDVAAQIFNFINSKSVDSKIADSFKGILEENTKEVKNPDMSIYSKYLPQNYSEQFEPMDELVFENFCEDLKKIKLLDGVIPEEFCDFIINQKLNNNTPINKDIDKYLPLLKRTFEDKACYILKSNGIEDYRFKFFKGKEGDGTQGYQNADKKEIGFLVDNLINLDASNTHIINTMFHEIQHAIQAKNYTATEFNKLNGFLYNTLKEEIIRKDDWSFYNRNYSRMYCEIDARLAGARGQAEYLAYIGIPENQIIEGNDTTLKECYEYAKEIERQNEEFAINKIDINGNIISVSEKVRELIKKNPEWINKYPVLSLEYNENGERKTTIQILQNALDSTKNKEKSTLEEIYTKIFEGNIENDLNSTVQSLKFISKILEENIYDRDKMLNFVNLIIDNEILYSLSKADKKSEEFNDAISELRVISQKNNDLKVNSKVNEVLTSFEKNGEMNYEQKIDKELSDTAITKIAQRKIKTMEDFDKVLEDIDKILKNPEKYNFHVGLAFMQLFEKQLENHTELDIMLMLEKSVNIIPKGEIKNVIISVIKDMPADIQEEKMGDIINTFWQEHINKYDYCKLKDARKIVQLIQPVVLKNNPNFIKQIFGYILTQGELPFLKYVKDAQEFEKTVQDAKENGANYSLIYNGMVEIINDEAKKGNINSIEMLYSELEQIHEKDKSSAISNFFLYASDELKEKI